MWNSSDIQPVRDISFLSVEAFVLRFTEVIHADFHPTLSEGNETRLRAHGFDVSSRELVSRHHEFFEVDIFGEVHPSSVNLEDLALCFLVGQWELNLAINTSWSDEGRVE